MIKEDSKIRENNEGISDEIGEYNIKQQEGAGDGPKK